MSLLCLNNVKLYLRNGSTDSLETKIKFIDKSSPTHFCKVGVQPTGHFGHFPHFYMVYSPILSNLNHRVQLSVRHLGHLLFTRFHTTPSNLTMKYVHFSILKTYEVVRTTFRDLFCRILQHKLLLTPFGNILMLCCSPLSAHVRMCDKSYCKLFKLKIQMWTEQFCRKPKHLHELLL